MSVQCTECVRNPSTFIKGLNLCHEHVDRLTRRCGQEGGKVIAATASSILQAINADSAGQA